MLQSKFFWTTWMALLFFAPGILAQGVQSVTITVGEHSKEKFFLEPKEVTVSPGKVEFTLVNKGTINHNLRIRQGDKEIARPLRLAEPGKSVKGDPVELTAGEYEMVCTYTSGGSHKEMGMVGKLIVK